MRDSINRITITLFQQSTRGDETKVTNSKPKTIYYFDDDPGYEELQKITGGEYFTTSSLADGRTMFLNELGEHTLTCEMNKDKG